MGTRGIYGFRKNGQDKLTYNHWDSYPDHLGWKVAQFVATTSIEDMNSIYDRVELVREDTKPTPEQIAACRRYENLNVSTGSEDDWYCLIRELQGEPQKWRDMDGTIYMIDNHDFIKDSLFCEYGYIINLDKNTLEFWEGFQKGPQDGNRYGETPGDDGYYPCRFVTEFPIDLVLLGGADWAVDEMNKSMKD